MAAEVGQIEKKGDWYRVKGHKDGKNVSVDIHAVHIEGKSEKEAMKQFKRAVEICPPDN